LFTNFSFDVLLETEPVLRLMQSNLGKRGVSHNHHAARIAIFFRASQRRGNPKRASLHRWARFASMQQGQFSTTTRCSRATHRRRVSRKLRTRRFRRDMHESSSGVGKSRPSRCKDLRPNTRRRNRWRALPLGIGSRHRALEAFLRRQGSHRSRSRSSREKFLGSLVRSARQMTTRWPTRGRPRVATVVACERSRGSRPMHGGASSWALATSSGRR
jgi:hypothetical protein